MPSREANLVEWAAFGTDEGDDLREDCVLCPLSELRAHVGKLVQREVRDAGRTIRQPHPFGFASNRKREALLGERSSHRVAEQVCA